MVRVRVRVRLVELSEYIKIIYYIGICMGVFTTQRYCKKELVGVKEGTSHSTSHYLKDTNTSYVQIINGRRV